ncbi:Flp family type IVb pilin [Fredinandcohnia humi]
MQKIKQFFTEEKGQGMTEYGLILGLIALAAVAAMTLFGTEISEKFGEVTEKLTGTSGTTTGTTDTTGTTSGQ